MAEAKKQAKKSKAEVPAKMGRPSSYTPELAAIICKRISDGESLRTICLSDEIPSITSVMRWLGDESRADFREQYACAREAQADKYAEEIIQIADDGLNDSYVDEEGNKRTDQDVIARSRLRVDARKWYASKLAPKKYGDKVENTLQGPNGGPISHNIDVTFVSKK